MPNLPIAQSLAAAKQNIPALEKTNAAADSDNPFKQLVEQTNQDQQLSDQAIQDLIEQKPGSSVQQVVMAVAQAEMSFQFFMEIRNQLIDSYNELMRMQF